MNDFLRSLSPENQLVIALCRLSFTQEHRKYIADLVEKVTKWDHFTHQANEHGVAAIVCINLKELGLIDRLPEKKAAFLRNAYLKSLSRNAMLFEKYMDVKNILEEAGITPILLKGMALELTVYGNIGLRQMNDIDILIDQDKCIKAWDLLRSKGFESIPPKSNLYKQYYLFFGKHLPELYKEGVSFEVHHKIFDFPKNINSLHSLTQLNKVVIDESLHLMLPMKIHFLYLVNHLEYHEEHGDSQLRLYMDLCHVMSQCTLDIKSSGIVDLAEKTRLIEFLSKKIYILHLLWDITIPESLSPVISENTMIKTIEIFKQFLSNPKNNLPLSNQNDYKLMIKKIPGLWLKFLYVFAVFFPSLTYLVSKYKLRSRYTAVVYYPVLWWDLIWRILKNK